MVPIQVTKKPPKSDSDSDPRCLPPSQHHAHFPRASSRTWATPAASRPTRTTRLPPRPRLRPWSALRPSTRPRAPIVLSSVSEEKKRNWLLSFRPSTFANGEVRRHTACVGHRHSSSPAPFQHRAARLPTGHSPRSSIAHLRARRARADAGARARAQDAQSAGDLETAAAKFTRLIQLTPTAVAYANRGPRPSPPP